VDAKDGSEDLTLPEKGVKISTAPAPTDEADCDACAI